MKNKSIKFLLFMFIAFSNTIYSYNYDHLQKVLAFAQSTDRTNRDLTSLDLSGAPLKGLDLSGGNFTNTDFRKANLMHTRWNNPEYNNEEDGYTNLSFAKLGGARLNYAQINRTLMLSVNAPGAVFNRTKLWKVNAAYGNFKGAKFRRAKLHKTNLAHTNIDNTNLRKCKFRYVNLEKTETRNNVKFEGAKWIRILRAPVNNTQELQQTIRIKGLPEENFIKKAIQKVVVEKLKLVFEANIQFLHSALAGEKPVEIIDHRDDDMPMPNQIFYDPSCPICQQNFNDCEQIAVTPCGHTFHQECINQALSRDPGICPTCRTQGITRWRSLAYMQ
jgi:uncharacterized protein YjbI with pentapeptide repeats